MRDNVSQLRDWYKRTPTLREIVKFIPFLGPLLDALITPDDQPAYFTPIDQHFPEAQRSMPVGTVLGASNGAGL